MVEGSSPPARALLTEGSRPCDTRGSKLSSATPHGPKHNDVVGVQTITDEKLLRIAVTHADCAVAHRKPP